MVFAFDSADEIVSGTFADFCKRLLPDMSSLTPCVTVAWNRSCWFEYKMPDQKNWKPANHWTPGFFRKNLSDEDWMSCTLEADLANRSAIRSKK